MWLPDGSQLDKEMTKKEEQLNQRQIKYSTKYEPDALENLEESVLKIVDNDDEKFVFIALTFKKGEYICKQDFQYEDKKKDFSILYLREDNGTKPGVIGNQNGLLKPKILRLGNKND